MAAVTCAYDVRQTAAQVTFTLFVAWFHYGELA